MTILLTKDLRVGGVVLASGTTQTFAADLEADIVDRKGATYLTDPTPGKTVPVVATTDVFTGVLELSAGGIVIPSAGPAFTFANLPAASLMAGETVRVTDVGPTGAGSLWISDGTRWRTLTGRQLLSSNRTGTLVAPLASVTAVSQLALPAAAMVSAGAILLPANLLATGAGLLVSAHARHTGTAGTWSCVARIGTSNTASDASISTTTGSATNDVAGWLYQEIDIATATSFTTGYNLAPSGSSAAGSFNVRTTNFDVTQPMYVGFYAASVTGPDAVQLNNYSVWLIG